MQALNCKSYCQAGFTSVSQLAKTGSNSTQNSLCNKGDYKEPKTEEKVRGTESQYETLTGTITDILTALSVNTIVILQHFIVF